MTGHGPPPLPEGIPASPAALTANVLHSTAIHLLRAVAMEDRSLGVSPERLSLLSVLVYVGPMSIGQLADAEGVSDAAVSRSVTALDRLGLVHKRREQRDTRVVTVAATTAGKKLLDQGRHQRLVRLIGMLDGLDDDDLATLRRACAMLNDP